MSCGHTQNWPGQGLSFVTPPPPQPHWRGFLARPGQRSSQMPRGERGGPRGPQVLHPEFPAAADFLVPFLDCF